MSIRIPVKVLIKETASAPFASAAKAISVISVTLGESLTIKGLEVFFLTPLVISLTPFVVVPN